VIPSKRGYRSVDSVTFCCWDTRLLFSGFRLILHSLTSCMCADHTHARPRFCYPVYSPTPPQDDFITHARCSDAVLPHGVCEFPFALLPLFPYLRSHVCVFVYSGFHVYHLYFTAGPGVRGHGCRAGCVTFPTHTPPLLPVPRICGVVLLLRTILQLGWVVTPHRRFPYYDRTTHYRCGLRLYVPVSKNV